MAPEFDPNNEQVRHERDTPSTSDKKQTAMETHGLHCVHRCTSVGLSAELEEADGRSGGFSLPRPTPMASEVIYAGGVCH